MKKFISLIIILFAMHRLSMAQETIFLYDKVPNSRQDAAYIEKADTGNDGIIRISQVSNPSVTVYHPAENINQHTAIIICPGGGYSILAYNWEGTSVAETLVKWGITAVVLKYRLPSDAIMMDKTVGPLQDAQRAIQLVRENAKAWNVNADNVGIMGFSAGGHLAATLSTHYTKAVIDNPKNISLRPDFSVLIYPVISFQNGLTHTGTHDNLIGKHPDSALESLYSCELQVTKETPPAFIALAQDDDAVKPENSILYYQALSKNNIPAEIHIYQNGGHGFALDFKRTHDNWTGRLKHWLKNNHYIHTKTE